MRRIIKNTPSQLTQYEAGLGCKQSVTRNRTGKLGIFLGKLFGHGLTENIESGYLFLLENYEPGDHIFFFGFSRGAYAVTHGCHALAIDEKRPKFEPLLWDESRIKDHQIIQQVWFPGSNSDVGGGMPKEG